MKWLMIMWVTTGNVETPVMVSEPFERKEMCELSQTLAKEMARDSFEGINSSGGMTVRLECRGVEYLR